jgi:hypothetical protein
VDNARGHRDGESTAKSTDTVQASVTHTLAANVENLILLEAGTAPSTAPATRWTTSSPGMPPTTP